MWAITEHYRQSNANVHRGVHFLSQRSTDMLEQARQTVADYIGAASPDEIIFTAGTTESLNQLARMLKNQIRPGQQILVSAMEHHSNLLPWQILCKETGTELNLIPLDENCDLDLDAFQELLQKPTTLVCVAWVSNVLGTVNPVDRVVKMAHNAGALVCVDGAQAMKQENINVQMFDCDFFAFSGHKLGALTGIGVLYGKRVVLRNLPLVNYGGGMIEKASYSGFTPGTIPQRLEAGTPNYVGAISLMAAMEYLSHLNREDIARQEQMLTELIEEQVGMISGVHLLGRPKQRLGAVSLWVDGIHAFDLGTLLDAQGIAVRTGHMCAQPLVEALGHPHVLRISPAFYNTVDEIKYLQKALIRAVSVIKGSK